jgi:hypothetical protein
MLPLILAPALRRQTSFLHTAPKCLLANSVDRGIDIGHQLIASRAYQGQVQGTVPVLEFLNTQGVLTAPHTIVYSADVIVRGAYHREIHHLRLNQQPELHDFSGTGAVNTFEQIFGRERCQITFSGSTRSGHISAATDLPCNTSFNLKFIEALRRVFRDTLNRAASSRSVGSFPPGAQAPSSMFAMMNRTIASTPWAGCRPIIGNLVDHEHFLSHK